MLLSKQQLGSYFELPYEKARDMFCVVYFYCCNAFSATAEQSTNADLPKEEKAQMPFGMGADLFGSHTLVQNWVLYT